jgi:S1-C subfamily serine protease
MLLRAALRLSPFVAALLLAACEAPEPPAGAGAAATSAPAPRAAPALPRANADSSSIERLGFSVRAGPHGLVIVAIDLDGPAAQAGTRVGDVVLGVNGATPASAAELQRLVGAAQQGIELQLHRSGAPHRVAIRLADPDAAGAWTSFGLQVRDLTESARRALGVTHGVMVTKVRAPADRTRILPGDVIIAVDREKVQGAEDFGRLAQRAAARRSGAVGLLVKRADADLFITFEPGEAGLPAEDRYRRRAPRDTPLRT